VPQAGSVSGHAVSRTPQDIRREDIRRDEMKRSRGGAAGGGAAVEVPNRTTVPKSEYLKGKQRDAGRGCKAASKTNQ
jgi:hypothetical protein